MKVSQVNARLLEFFSSSAKKEAIASGFVKRQSKIDPHSLLQALTFGIINNPKASLEELCYLYYTHTGMVISKQALHKRCNDEFVLFLKLMTERALLSFMASGSEAEKYRKLFRSIKIADSTDIELPSSMSSLYRGRGGAASDAAMKLHVQLDYQNGGVCSTGITGGCDPDTTYKDHLLTLEEGDLSIQDMGFFSRENFRETERRKAWYISRIPSCVTVTVDGKEIDGYLRGSKLKVINIAEAGIGRREKLNTRLIAINLPPEIAEERLRKSTERARKRGRTLSEHSRLWCQWGIYMTNIPENMLKAEDIVGLYRVRWQIELMFRSWKQLLSLENIRTRNKSSTLVFIYVKIIAALVMTYTAGPLQWFNCREISYWKVFRFIRNESRDFLSAITSKKSLKRVLDKIMIIIQIYCFKDPGRTLKKHISTIISMPYTP